MGSFLINDAEKNIKKKTKKQKKLVLQILLYFQEKGVSIETVLNFACNLPC